MPMPGIGEMVLIFGVILLLFGGKKLPELGKSLGESVKNFRTGIRETEKDKEQDKLAAPARRDDDGRTA